MAEVAEQFKKPLPKAVRNQARKAERDHKKAYSPPEEVPEIPKAPEGTASAAVLQMAAQEPQEPPHEEGVASTSVAAPAASQEPPEPPEPPAAPKEDWEQKYRTLQGMIEREVREKKALQQQIDGLQNTIAAVTSVQQTDSPPASGAQDKQQRLKAEDVEAYGEDMINVIRATAHDEFMPTIAELRKENSRLKEQLGGVADYTRKSEVQQTEALLNKEVPNWRQVNEDPEFLQWLGEPDPFSGRLRHDLLQEAGVNGPRILAFFKAYLTESQAIRGRQEAPQQAPQPPQAQRQGPIVDPTSLVAPGRPAVQNAGAGAAVDSEEPQIFTQKQITTFYREVQQGKWKNRPQDKDKLERAIHKAAMEGRVR
jgi:hypothetical protein